MNLKVISAIAAGLLSAAPAISSAATLDFEGATSFASIAGFYNGGTDSNGASGTNFGASFGLDAQALSNDVLGPYFSNAPTPITVMTAVGSDAALNVGAGFAGQASFYYSSSEAATVGIYSGLNGSGDLLGTFNLGANAQNGGCTDTNFCHWDLASLDFNGVAHSIQFGSAPYLAAFDNVAVSPVPLPAAAWLMLSGLGGLGSLVRRKRVA